MSSLATPIGLTATGTATAVSLPRRHVLLVALLVCIPLPLLSLAAMVLPLPQLLERATATFISFATQTEGQEGVIRERAQIGRAHV